MAEIVGADAPESQGPEAREPEIVEEIETLEEIEEFIPEEAEPLDAEPDGAEPNDISLDSSADRDAWVASVQENFPLSKKVFHTCVFPVLIMTPEFYISFANKACKHLFHSTPKIEGCQFINTFGKYFKIDDIKNIREIILKGTNSYSWKGKAYIKSRERTTVETRVYIFPTSLDNHVPVEFGVMFDDVTEEMRHLLRGVFMSLLEASKLKDNDTGQHIVRVNYYSETLARVLRNRPGYDIVDADFIDNIGFLAAMHDVGKIGTPDDILNKAGPLSDFEWGVMKEHTINGAFILSTYPNPMAREIAVAHHEKWNGTGYPYQLSGDTIPLAARIVSLADVYDALRMKRCYKPPFTHEVAVKKILESKGTQFDPDLVDVMLTVADTFNELYEKYADDPTPSGN
ncbi:MAG: HD domain-containing protein [Spirochaetaceae bacterium]|jgi:putative two-component system response regulator|nr:HD domain-containing protein [Spirochaetaceae bacterium]